MPTTSNSPDTTPHGDTPPPKPKGLQIDTQLGKESLGGSPWLANESSCSIDGENDETPRKVVVKRITQSTSSGTTQPSSIREVHSIWKVCIAGGILCLCSGWINAVSYKAFNSSATHVSGTATQIGLQLAVDEFITCAEKAGLLLVFIAGSMVSSLYLGGSRKFRGGVRYAHLLLGISVAIFFGMALAKLHHEYSALLVLTLVSGSQNALTTSYSGAAVRITHVTGTATDIGIEIGKIVGHGDFSGLWRLKLFSSFLTCFILGGYFGSLAYAAGKINALLVPGLFTAILGIVYRFLLLCPNARVFKCAQPGAEKGLFVETSMWVPRVEILKTMPTLSPRSPFSAKNRSLSQNESPRSPVGAVV